MGDVGRRQPIQLASNLPLLMNSLNFDENTWKFALIRLLEINNHKHENAR